MWPHFPLELGISASVRTYPFASVTASETWTTFQFHETGTDFNMGLPWRFTDGFERIKFYTQAVCNSDARIAIRWDSETLIDEVRPIA